MSGCVCRECGEREPDANRDLSKWTLSGGASCSMEAISMDYVGRGAPQKKTQRAERKERRKCKRDRESVNG